jgi:hypothetical protein
MPRQKRTSRVLEKAELRSAGLKAIDPNIDFGDACSLQNLSQQIEKLRSQLEAYNTALAALDYSRIELDQMEKNLASFSEKMLLGVACKYGKDSNKYMMAGGVRKSDRIRKSIATRRKTAAQVKSQNAATL